MAARPFHVHVGDLLAAPGSVRSHRIVAPVEWGVDLAQVAPDAEVDADLELASTSGGIMVRGTVDFDALLTCSRCLTEAQTPMHVEIAQLAEAGGEDDDEYHLDGDVLDLEPILRDEVLLAMPLRPRCDPACEGLVPAAENDLNTAAPGSARRPDSPFAALQDLFGPGD